MLPLLWCVLPANAHARSPSSTFALVVGNERYASERPEGAREDAERLAEALESIGVDVRLAIDVRRHEWAALERELAARAGGASLVIVVYVGHALQLGDTAYVVPVDVSLSSRSDRNRLPRLQSLIDAAAGAEHLTVVLDTCHASSLAAGWGERFARGAVCGDSRTTVSVPAGAQVVFATRTPHAAAARRGGSARFLRSLASGLDSSSNALAGTIAAAAATARDAGDGRIDPVIVGSLDPNVVPGTPAVATAAAEPEETSASATIAAGTYRVLNLYRSRQLAIGSDGVPALASPDEGEARGMWVVVSEGAGALRLTNVHSGRSLSLADGGAPITVPPGDADGEWRTEPVSGGVDGEYGLRHRVSGRYLSGDARSGQVGSDVSPGSTGWLLDMVEAPPAPVEPAPVSTTDPLATTEPMLSAEARDEEGSGRSVRLTVRTVPADARVRILNIAPVYSPGMLVWPAESYVVEVSHADHPTLERIVRVEDEDVDIEIRLDEGGPETPIVPVVDTVRLTIRTVPADATISVRGLDGGTVAEPEDGPGLSVSARETYAVEVSHSDHLPLRRIVRVRDEDVGIEMRLGAKGIRSVEAVVTPSPASTPEPTLGPAPGTERNSGSANAAAETGEADAPPAIDAADKAEVLAKLRAVRDAIESGDKDALTDLLRDGPARRRFMGLIDAYPGRDVEIFYLRASEDRRRLLAELRIESLVDANGDRVVPSSAFRDTTLSSERLDDGWSTLAGERDGAAG